MSSALKVFIWRTFKTFTKHHISFWNLIKEWTEKKRNEWNSQVWQKQHFFTDTDQTLVKARTLDPCLFLKSSFSFHEWLHFGILKAVWNFGSIFVRKTPAVRNVKKGTTESDKTQEKTTERAGFERTSLICGHEKWVVVSLEKRDYKLMPVL